MMKFAVARDKAHRLRDRMVEKLVSTFLAHGHELCDDSETDVQMVLNLTDARQPRPYRRQARAVYVVTFVASDQLPDDAERAVYTLLVRSLSNLAIYAIPRNGSADVHFTTLEAGFYHIPFDPEAVYRHILPLATSRLVIENELIPDLPDAYWQGTSVTRKMIHYGGELDRLGVLPAPFPIRDLLSERDLRHVYRLYGITGLSYGNLSARDAVPELGQTTYWMTARGVNKAELSGVGHDLLLIRGYDPERATILVSVPPFHDSRARASVDAIEHYLIYSAFPQVGAIVHVHAWMEGVPSTQQNYPCGTHELAEEVVSQLQRTPDPSRAVIGLKNHGLTITGHDLDEIFDRIRGRLLTQVPMMI
jgi:ribulose-5-phosphate 4-epimerase/fuculose-1-phosphate aldolase